MFTNRIERTLPKPSAAPFFLPGEKASVLLLHGFTGSPFEVRTIADALNEVGYSCDGPLLPGHGRDPSELAEVSYKDWLDAAFAHLAKLPPDRPRIVIGLSMGGLLASMLAARYPTQIDGLVLLAPVFYLRPLAAFGAWLSALGVHHLVPFVEKHGGSDVEDEQARKINPAYPRVSLKGLVELRKLQVQAMAEVPNVKCPTFVAYGQRDGTIHNEKSFQITSSLKVDRLEHHFFPRSRHLLPVDVERDHLIAWILQFCETLHARIPLS